MSEEEFVARFVAHMLSIVGPFDGEGEPVEPYARETAASYYETPWQRENGPEQCAADDISYWEAA